MQDKSEWRGFLRENAWGVAIVRDCQSYRKPLGGNSVCGRACNLQGIKGKISFFLFFSFLNLNFYCSSFHGIMRADPPVVGRDNE